MSKSKKRKPPIPKKQPAPKATTPKIPKSPLICLLQWLTNHPIPRVLGLLAAVLAIGTPIYETLQEPEIREQLGDSQTPFALPFSMTNRSHIFWMKSTTFVCLVPSLKAGGLEIINGSLKEINLQEDIKPGETKLYKCPFEKITLPPNWTLETTTIKIRLLFHTLWFERETISENFNWDGVTKRWTRGQIIN
jgi:hypothetical protein